MEKITAVARTEDRPTLPRLRPDTLFPTHIQIDGLNCCVLFDRYDSGRVRLEVLSLADGETVSVITRDAPVELSDNEAAIDFGDETDSVPIFRALVDAGILESSYRYVKGEDKALHAVARITGTTD